jgi:hypothetical protein
MTDPSNPGEAPPGGVPPEESRRRVILGWLWVISRNVLGWVLILASFVTGPLIPGPGGIPLFLVGFALISFPGKRRLTARALRGLPVRFRTGPFVVVSLAVALALPAVVLEAGRRWLPWLEALWAGEPVVLAVVYLLGVAATWLAARSSPHVLNLALRALARARRSFRPWLRRQGVHLLPPRWRRRQANEPGKGPLNQTSEILKFSRRAKK